MELLDFDEGWKMNRGALNRGGLLCTLLSVAALLSACSKVCKVNGVADDVAGGAPGTAEDFAANVPNTVYFDFDKSRLSEAAKKRVQAQAVWLKTYSDKRVTVSGHADVRGTAEYNMALGQARANSTAAELKRNDVASDRIETQSFGKERPVDDGATEAAHARNRRTETVVNR
jgi:peptidoglycan-associated lipoprotein